MDWFGFDGNTIIICIGIWIVIYNQNKMAKGLDKIYKITTHKVDIVDLPEDL